MSKQEFAWLEFEYRPLKDGLHDSGYRFIRLTGVNFDEHGKEIRTDLHQWSDHVVFHAPVNIDVTSDGTIRIMPWASKGKWLLEDMMFFSSAMFYSTDPEGASELILSMKRVREKVAKDMEELLGGE